MAKLSRANLTDSISVVLPKKITEKIWKVGDEVQLESIGTDTILLSRDSWEKIDLDQSILNVGGLIKQYYELNEKKVMPKELLTKGFKQALINEVKRI